MKQWKPEDWVRIILAFSVAYFICCYVTGMFILKQATNDQNKDLRMAIVLLIGVVVNSILNNNKKPN